MATFQDVIDSVRVDLTDPTGTRYTTPQLMGYANDGIQESYRLRPDFQLGNFTAATVTYTESQEVPLPAKYQMLLKHYVSFRAEMRDDEYSIDGRAAAMLSRFQTEMSR
jgi:hypothetical protein